MAELLIENLSKRFGARQEISALENFSVRIAPGELLALLGPSGSGKTTVLRLIAGLEKPSEGGIVLGGKSLEAVPAQERGIGMVFQYPALLPQLTILKNLTLGPSLRKVPAAEALEQARRIACLLGITELLERKPETLSGGQQQRAALARALLCNPRIALLDEPLANLDPISRQELRSVIRRIQRELRVTMIYVTHDQAEAVEIADRIAVIDGGRLQQAGSARELHDNPENLFVARFIGPEALNILNGQLQPGKRGVLVSEGGETCSLPISDSPDFSHGGSVLAAFRGDAVQRVRDGDGLPVMVEEVRDHGWKKTAVLRFGNQRLSADCRGAGEFKPAEKVSIGVRTLFAFDPVSGRRIS